MNKVLIMGWILGSTLAAYYVGLRIGKTYIHGRMHARWVIALLLMFVLLAAWISFGVLSVSIEYVFWIFILAGSLGRGALMAA